MCQCPARPPKLPPAGAESARVYPLSCSGKKSETQVWSSWFLLEALRADLLLLLGSWCCQHPGRSTVSLACGCAAPISACTPLCASPLPTPLRTLVIGLSPTWTVQGGLVSSALTVFPPATASFQISSRSQLPAGHEFGGDIIQAHHRVRGGLSPSQHSAKSQSSLDSMTHSNLAFPQLHNVPTAASSCELRSGAREQRPHGQTRAGRADLPALHWLCAWSRPLNLHPCTCSLPLRLCLPPRQYTLLKHTVQSSTTL